MGKEVRIGVSGLCKYPGSAVRSVEEMAVWASVVDGEFLVHVPGWHDWLRGRGSYPDRDSLAVPVMAVESSWYEDRVVELATPLPTLRITPKKVAGCAGFPPFPNRVTRKMLEAFSDAYLVRRWPVLSEEVLGDTRHGDLLRRRNEVLGRYPGHRMEMLDVHSKNLRLSPDEILKWKDEEGRDRRIMFTWPDERLPEHDLGESEQLDFLEPLLSYVSAVSLKVANVRDAEGGVLMTRGAVIHSIAEGREENEYARGITDLVERVGDKVEGGLDLVIKVKGGVAAEVGGRSLGRDEFVKRMVGYVGELVS